ncbi:hypothetical protein N7507_002742 [Penicillium longicatenatum]|nr:hypothetical protein N7507_002742 [Penicillium longicatenatum]
MSESAKPRSDSERLSRASKMVIHLFIWNFTNRICDKQIQERMLSECGRQWTANFRCVPVIVGDRVPFTRPCSRRRNCGQYLKQMSTGVPTDQFEQRFDYLHTNVKMISGVEQALEEVHSSSWRKEVRTGKTLREHLHCRDLH